MTSSIVMESTSRSPVMDFSGVTSAGSIPAIEARVVAMSASTWCWVMSAGSCRLGHVVLGHVGGLRVLVGAGRGRRWRATDLLQLQLGVVLVNPAEVLRHPGHLVVAQLRRRPVRQVQQRAGDPGAALDLAGAGAAQGVADQLLRTAGVRADVLPADGTRAQLEQPVGVGALLLTSLEDVERHAPVVLLVDDVQWADVDSLRALLFALRRLVDERVLTLLVARAEDAPELPEGLRRLAGGTTGRSISLDALDSHSVQRLATALGVPQFSMRTAQRVCDHTRGNPLYVRALLTELPADRWQNWEPALPAPAAFAGRIVSRLATCGPSARALVEACSVLGVRSALPAATALARARRPDQRPGAGGHGQACSGSPTRSMSGT